MEKAKTKRFQKISLLGLLPSSITLLAIYLGFTSLKFAVDEKFENVFWMILAAAFLDALDGRVARLVKGDSRFGAELDSLADFLNFGIAPAFTIWAWGLHRFGNLGWVLAFFFVLCCVLRLARFNASIDTDENNQKYFKGLPAPAGGILIFTPMIISFIGVENEIVQKVLLLLFTIGGGLLMISVIPTFSLKGLHFQRSHYNITRILLVMVVIGVFILNFPFISILALEALYLISIPYIMFLRRRQN